MDKKALQEIGKSAAQKYLDDGTDPTSAVEKEAEKHGLTGEQTERVAHYANQTINSALMEKNAYTEFPLADPEDIDPPTSGNEKVAFVPDVGGPAEKTAEDETDTIPVGGLFSKIADLYGAKYVPSPNPERNGRRMLKAAEIVAKEALRDLEAHQRKLANSREKLYEEAKNSLYEGTDIEAIVSGLEEKDVGKDVIKYVLNRLEAEGMVPTSEYDDAGPYSEERRYLKEGREMIEDSPMAKAAEEVKALRKHAALDANSVVLSAHVAEHAPKLAGVDPEVLQEKQAGIFSAVGKGLWDMGKGLGKGVGKATKKTVETGEDVAKNVGNWVAQDPLLRSIELGLGGYAGGKFLGDQKNDMTEPKQQFA